MWLSNDESQHTNTQQTCIHTHTHRCVFEDLFQSAVLWGKQVKTTGATSAGFTLVTGLSVNLANITAYNKDLCLDRNALKI